MMQWMRRCCLHIVLLVVTYGGGQSADEALVATAQLTRQAVLDARSSNVFRRVDGLIIPWQKQARPHPTCLRIHCTWACAALAKAKCVNWGYGLTFSPLRYITHLPLAREEAQTVVDTTLASADMYQHLSYFGKVLPYAAFFNLLDLLRHRMQARKHATDTKMVPAAATPEQEVNRGFSPGSLSELFTEFLEQYAQRTCRVAERRMRCIQLRQALRDAESADSYPQIIYEHLWHREQGPWSRFIHERDLEALWMPM